MVFRLIDSEFLESFQSGVYYADRETPKSSLPAVAAAATKYRSRTISRLRDAARPDAGDQLADANADLRCRLRLRRRRSAASARRRRLRRSAGRRSPESRHRLPQAKLKPGRYRITLRVTATAYKANAFTATSPPFG